MVPLLSTITMASGRCKKASVTELTVSASSVPGGRPDAPGGSPDGLARGAVLGRRRVDQSAAAARQGRRFHLIPLALRKTSCSSTDEIPFHAWSPVIHFGHSRLGCGVAIRLRVTSRATGRGVRHTRIGFDVGSDSARHRLPDSARLGSDRSAEVGPAALDPPRSRGRSGACQTLVARIPRPVEASEQVRGVLLCSRRGLRALRRRGVDRRARVRLHRHHLPPGQGARHRAHRLRPPGGAQRLPASHRRRAAGRLRARAPDEPTWAASS